LRRQTFRSDCELEGARRDIGKRELSIVVGLHLLACGLTFPAKPHYRSADAGSGLIDNFSADTARLLLIGVPLIG